MTRAPLISRPADACVAFAVAPPTGMRWRTILAPPLVFDQPTLFDALFFLSCVLLHTLYTSFCATGQKHEGSPLLATDGVLEMGAPLQS